MKACDHDLIIVIVLVVPFLRSTARWDIVSRAIEQVALATNRDPQYNDPKSLTL